MKFIRHAATTLTLAVLLPAAHAVPIPIANHSFEIDLNNNFEFFFGNPTGWGLFDPNNIIDGGGDVQGTLTVTGGPYFGGVAPDGDNVAIVFIGSDTGGGEVGLTQVLGDNLAGDTHYSLSVDVGNINSGDTRQFGLFDLSGFPGFRLQLLAGGVVLAEAVGGIDALTPGGALIDEAEFETVTLDFTTGAAHAQLGQALEIRLINRNIIDPFYTPPAFPNVDLEVDFDNVRLEAVAVARVPEPATWWLLAVGLAMLCTARRPNLAPVRLPTGRRLR